MNAIMKKLKTKLFETPILFYPNEVKSKQNQNKMDNLRNTYTFGNYEISIMKTSDSVTIRFLDKDLFKVFQKTFSELTIGEICPVGLDNFYVMCQNSLNLNEKIFPANSIITVCSNNVTINIEYKSDINFKFDLVLPFVEETKTSSERLYIKQLETKIEQMETKIEQMETKIEQLETNLLNDIDDLGSSIFFSTYTRGCCQPNPPISGSIPLVCNKVTLSLYDNNNQISDYVKGEYLIPFHTCQKDKITQEFKNIKTKLLEIKSSNPAVLNDDQYKSIFTNFPKRIEKLILNNLRQDIPRYIALVGQYVKIDILEIRNCANLNLNVELLKGLEKLGIKEIMHFNCQNINIDTAQSTIILTGLKN